MVPSIQPLYLGIDIGTSGCRLAIIDGAGKQLCFHSSPLPASTTDQNRAEQDPLNWWQTLCFLIKNKLDTSIRQHIVAISVDGTSASLLLCDKQGQPLTPCLMYNDCRAISEAAQIDNIAPTECSPVRGPSSALAKLLHFEDLHITDAYHALHQADWISNRLTGRFGVSDSNNCLKLGYDPVAQQWPGWLLNRIKNPSLLPTVAAPGNVIGHIDNAIAASLTLPNNVLIVSGTTDSIAAARASGAVRPGDAITSLGSTLVVKIVSETPISSTRHGIYSHPYGDNWLVGGASNSGGAVLLAHFSLEQIKEMSEQINPEYDTGLDYYPLLGVGERFPIADTSKQPKLSPRPEQDVLFFQAMLEGISNIEALAYQRLIELGATPVQRIFSVGGGSKNKVWQCLRERKLERPMTIAISDEAAYGSALLAREGYSKRNNYK